jgi:hypothetical protein
LPLGASDLKLRAASKKSEPTTLRRSARICQRQGGELVFAALTQRQSPGKQRRLRATGSEVVGRENQA